MQQVCHAEVQLLLLTFFHEVLVEECPKKRDAIVEKVNAIRGKSRSREEIKKEKMMALFKATD